MKRPDLVLLALCAACSPSDLAPEPQVLLYVDTDAPMPPAPGDDLAPGEHPPLFDTLRADVYPPGTEVPCTGCTHEFAVDRDMFNSSGVSFGVMVTEQASGYRVRLRLFNTRHRFDGDPSPYSSIDMSVGLPAVAPGEVAEYHVLLPTDAVAAPIGSLDAPVTPEPGPPATSRVGNWIEQSHCAGESRDGEVCIPGGAYWMGDAQTVLAVDWGDSPAAGDPREQRLVVMSPFFLDATEVTVGRFVPPPGASGFVEWSGDPQHYCTWSASAERATLPVNCVSWDLARASCNDRGADLPTEAQYEYVASGLRGSPFVWGDAQPNCDDAVWGRYPVQGPRKTDVCVGADTPAGAAPVGGSTKDRLAVAGGQEVVDLAGNVGEWVLDAFLPVDDPCWRSGVVYDPVCTIADGDLVAVSARGGAFSSWPAELIAAVRLRVHRYQLGSIFGFRCARADVPSD